MDDETLMKWVVGGFVLCYILAMAYALWSESRSLTYQEFMMQNELKRIQPPKLKASYNPRPKMHPEKCRKATKRRKRKSITKRINK